MSEQLVIKADPYDWPYNGKLQPNKTALVVIDMQRDFCEKGGYVDLMGYDISFAVRCIKPIQNVLKLVRQIGGFTVVHTREGHRPDLSDCAANKLWRSKRIGAGIGDYGPDGKSRILVRGEPGWAIIDDLKPVPGEIVLDKPGKCSFIATDFDHMLRSKGITHLVICGVTTDVCVKSTMVVANDLGYECLLLEDCCGATDDANHRHAVKSVKMSGGIFGSISNSADFIDAFKQFVQ